MAKKSSVERYKRNLKSIKTHQEKYKKLKEIIKSVSATEEDKEKARRSLAKLPKTALPVRLRIRCQVTGRARGVYRKFELNRHKFREFAHLGMLPGVAKASW